MRPTSAATARSTSAAARCATPTRASRSGRRSTASALTLALLVAGCAPPSRGPSTTAAIVGGAPSPGDTQVFLLEISTDTGAGTTCSATLIGPHSLLTAAHCVDPVSLGARVVTVRATNAPTRAEVTSLVDVVETRLHPGWMPAIALGHDLALLRLAMRQAPTPAVLNTRSLTGLGGAPLRAVGYGSDLTDGGLGTRRAVELELRQLSDELISLGDLSSRGVCHGDSGGPTFHTFDDGVERLIGVHSFTRSEACVDGADTRVDRELPFLLEWLDTHEDPCEQPGICARGACADPDCVTLGAPCETDYQCAARTCRGDAQHATTYCTAPCAGGCPSPMTCDVVSGRCQLPQLPTAHPGDRCVPGHDFCLDDTVCSGRVDAPTCSRRCQSTSTCPTASQCQRGFTGEDVCVPTPLTLPRASLVGPAAPRGCAAAPGLLAVLSSALMLRRRARSRRNC